MSNQVTVHQATPSALLEMAIQKGVDTQQLKELMDLQERWEKKEAKKAFLDALAKFQTLVPVIPKKRTAKITPKNGGNPFTYKFADLGTITDTIKEPLRDCGLSYRWDFQEENGKLKVNCHLSHRDGHSETTSMEAGMDNSGAKNDIQQKGSTQTYLQRYTLIGALGLSTAEEDNDGKNHKTTQKDELTEEDKLAQWDDVLSQVRSRIELTGLYMKNKKVVDKSDVLKKKFKDRESQLPATKTKQTAEMP